MIIGPVVEVVVVVVVVVLLAALEEPPPQPAVVRQISETIVCKKREGARSRGALNGSFGGGKNFHPINSVQT